MKFKSMINSHQDLKKNGYKILRKLHKLERRTNLGKIYNQFCTDGYYVVLSCKNLAELLSFQYSKYDQNYIRSFLKKTDKFVAYLDMVARSKARINSTYLSNYLSAYTEFFNRISNEKIVFSVDKAMLAKWNIGCVMAYNAVWGN